MNILQQSWKLAPDRRTTSDKFSGGPVVFAISPDRLSSSLSLQINTAQLLKSLLHTERNQQIMCEYGYPHELLSHGYIALADETHPLHPALRSMLFQVDILCFVFCVMTFDLP
jgi:hypothetical protein